LEPLVDLPAAVAVGLCDACLAAVEQLQRGLDRLAHLPAGGGHRGTVFPGGGNRGFEIGGHWGSLCGFVLAPLDRAGRRGKPPTRPVTPNFRAARAAFLISAG